jgi:lipopolysaccharide export system protein LptA
MTFRAVTAALLALSLVPLVANAQAQRPAARPAPAAGSQSFALDPSGSQGPLAIDSDRLEVRDRDKMAIFTGNVVARRGDSTLRATAMTVFYDGDSPGRPAAQAQPAGGAPAQQQQQIRRIEMSGPVFFCQRTQTARGERAVYERANERLTMTGNVVLTDGPNVVTGPRLVVNLRTNQAQVEGDPSRPNERVRSLFQGGGQGQPAPQPAC